MSVGKHAIESLLKIVKTPEEWIPSAACQTLVPVIGDLNTGLEATKSTCVEKLQVLEQPACH